MFYTTAPTRRVALQGSLAALVAGCRADEPLDTGSLGSETPVGAAFESLLPFVDEEERALEVLTGAGLDGRLLTDLSTLESEGLIQANARFYVRTARSALLETSETSPAWSVVLDGLVAEAVVLDIEDVRALAVPQGVVQFECSGNAGFGGFGLMSAAEWDGAPLADLLALVTPEAGAEYVRVTGFDTYPDPSETSEAGASWVFARSDLEAAGAFLATRMNGEDLPPDHGFPVRLVVPGWYGCCNIKWVEEIAAVGEDELPTVQMQEFAARTHQPGEPELAKDYIPAVIDVAAVVLRVELWREPDGGAVYRVVGVTWGGPIPANELDLLLGSGSIQRVAVSPPRIDGRGWSLWEAFWRPATAATYAVSLSVPDPAIRTRRLDTGYYTRFVAIPEGSAPA